MQFDFSAVLTHAWQITWKHRVLWVVGILFGLLISILFPLMFTPVLFPFFMQDSKTAFMPVLIIGGYILGILLFMLALYPINVLAQTALTLGIQDVEQDKELFSASELLKRSLPFFWRVLGLMLLFTMGLNLVILVIQAVMFFLTIVTLGVAAICMTPLLFLIYPTLYIAMVWMEQAMTGIIVDNMTVIEAAKQGWDLVRNNLMSVALMALVIYIGIGFVTGIAIMPLLIPLFIMPISFMENEPNMTILSISMLCTIAFIPLFAFISGLSMVFTKSAWVLTYLRLTRSSAAQPILLEAASS